MQISYRFLIPNIYITTTTLYIKSICRKADIGKRSIKSFVGAESHLKMILGDDISDFFNRLQSEIVNDYTNLRPTETPFPTRSNRVLYRYIF